MASLHDPLAHVLWKAMDTNITASGNGNSLNISGYQSVVIQHVVTTAAGATLSVQYQVSADNATWSNIGTPVTVAASQTNKNLVNGILAADMNNVVAGATYVRAVYTITGNTTVFATLGDLFVPLQKPCVQDNAGTLIGHTY